MLSGPQMHTDKRGVIIEEIDLVWLSMKFLSFALPFKKLDSTYFGSFPVEQQINLVAFHLQLSTAIMIHFVFHQSLLVREALTCSLCSRITLSDTHILVHGEAQYEVELLQTLHAVSNHGIWKYYVCKI